MRLKVRKHVSRLSPSEGVIISAMCTTYCFQQRLSSGLSFIQCRVNEKCRLHTSSTASQPGLHCTRSYSRVCLLATLCYFHRSNGITSLIGRGYGEPVPTVVTPKLSRGAVLCASPRCLQIAAPILPLPTHTTFQLVTYNR